VDPGLIAEVARWLTHPLPLTEHRLSHKRASCSHEREKHLSDVRQRDDQPQMLQPVMLGEVHQQVEPKAAAGGAVRQVRRHRLEAAAALRFLC